MTNRGSSPPQLDPVEAARIRYEQLSSDEHLRVSKAWELPHVAQRLIGLGAHEAGIDVQEVLHAACAAAGAAAVASSLRASDQILGRAVATNGTRRAVIVHERRPIDPIDFLRALQIAAVLGDRAVLGALAAALDDIDPDPAFAGRGGHERTFYRLAFGAFTAAALGDADRARDLAAELLRYEGENIGQIEAYRASRLQQLVVPMVAAVVAEDAAPAVKAALDAHQAHWSDPTRSSDPTGFIAWSALAAARVRTLSPGELPGSTFAPAHALALFSIPLSPTEILYDAGQLRAHSVDEARLRVELSAPGEIVEVTREHDGDRLRLSLEARGELTYRFQFLVDPTMPGAGAVDAGELVHVAWKERDRARAAGEGTAVGAAARDRGRWAAERALALLGTDEELFRDRMTSPLGRTLCDERPDAFTRKALAALAASFEATPPPPH